MFKDIKITKKFPLVMISLALLSAMATGVIAFINTTDSMKLAAQDKLISLLESRKSSLEQYFNTIEHDINFHAQSPLVVEALTGFSDAWKALPGDKTLYLKNHYIYQNPYKVGQKSSLLFSDDNSHYSRLHRRYHPTFKNMIEGRSFYDFFLLDRQGNLIYTVNKEADFATNVVTGQWQYTGLARVFRDINAEPEAGKLIYADFTVYAPSNNEPASFVGSPVYDNQYNYVGVVIYQMPIEPLDRIMQVTAGMGTSGETYLVGSDLLMRSNSRFLQDRSILKTKVDTGSVHLALKGDSGVDVIADYRNISVFSAYTPIDFLGTRWAMVVEVDEEEVLQPVYTMSNFLLISGVLIILVISVLGYLLATDISQPIVAMTRVMKQLSNNDLSVNISVNERNDEIGHMADAMVVFKQNAIERDDMHKTLSYIAEHDALTGLHTRKYALEQLTLLSDQAMVEDTRLVLMFIDIDDFKLINDTYGHQVGDKVLCDVATGLTACVRTEDIVARVGGDEFIVILPDVKHLNDSHQIAEKILSTIHLALPVPGDNSKLTLSIGLSVFPDDTCDLSLLMQQADHAMYSVKGRGKNSYGYWTGEKDNT